MIDTKKVFITVHRGGHQIGGSCVEIIYGEHILILDAGLPLDGIEASNGPIFQTKPLGVLLSHAHLDHWGLLNQIPDDVPIYGSQGTCVLLNEVAPIFLSKHPRQKINPIDSKKTFSIGSFTITPVPVDHSSPDALAFIIEVGDRRILYSGDFRAHGRTAWRFERLLNHSLIKSPNSEIPINLQGESP